MEDQNKAVETEEKAATPEVIVDDASVDPEAELKALRERAEKAERDRDNYRTGMLKAKGKLPDDEEDKPNLEELITKKVQETIAQTESAQAQKALEDFATKTARENKELKLALRNKQASTAIGGGAGAGSGEAAGSSVETSYWAPDQINELKKRGLTAEQITRAGELARTGQAQAPISR